MRTVFRVTKLASVRKTSTVDMIPAASPTTVSVLISAEFRDASCSAVQQLSAKVFGLDQCVAASSGDKWYTYECDFVANTFVANTYATANCSGDHSQYNGASGTCVENMGYTFSRFTCVNSAQWREFEAWQQRFGKATAYAALSSSELAAKFSKWRTNAEFIAAHNANPISTSTAAMNAFGDLSLAEFRALHPSAIARGAHAAATWRSAADAPTPPASWDWRGHGAVSPIKNQFEPNSCGSCWAFSAIAGVESRYALDGHAVESFSAQNLVDCTLNGSDTCNEGGEMHDGVMQIATEQRGKVSTSAAYAYTGLSKGVCHFADHAATNVETNVSGYANVTAGDESALLQALYSGGVIPAGINSDAQAFMFYSGGVLNVPAARCKAGPAALDHGVAIIGYGTDASSGLQYWHVKNSYGEYWGEKGYFRIVRGRNSCGIATDCIVVRGKQQL